MKPTLKYNKTVLSSPGGKLPVIGSFVGDIHFKGELYEFQVFVIDKELNNNLLSRGVSGRLGLVARPVEAAEIGLMRVEPVQIKLKSGAEPYAVHTARNVGFHILSKVETELKRMQDEGIIKPVETPTDWCAAMVPVEKKSGRVRICVDFKHLNQNVKRPFINLPNLDDIAPKLVGAQYFSTLDADSGFYQVPLASESMHLTTFITPFGRFCFQRLPMGINIGPEVFQLKMQKVLAGLKGCDVIMDDILVWGQTQQEHDQNLAAVTKRIKELGLTLNEDKCQIRQKRVTFFGHQLSAEGITPSRQKVEAILQMPAPSNVTELRSLCGMLNYLSKFTPQLATTIRPMTELLRSDVVYAWQEPQQAAFEKAKQAISSLPSLQFFSLSRQVVVSADASSYGLGAVLLQREGDKLLPISFASRTLTEAEKRYAQIERECLASVWACEKFSKYLVGLPEFELWTDHKPLVPLIQRKALDQAPLRCQRLLMRLLRFCPVVSHKPGKQLVIADALSRNPVATTESDLESKVRQYVDSVVSQLPISTNRLSKIRQAVVYDNELAEVLGFVTNGWPVVSVIPSTLKAYYEARDMLSIVDGLLTYQNRIVIPRDQRQEILYRLHESHQGFTKCLANAERCVWWPGIRKDLKTLCETCEKCLEKRPAQRSEPLCPTPLPSRPWEKVGADLCQFGPKTYLIIVDYYSRWIEIKHLTTTTSSAVINKCRQVFAAHGIPEEFHSDNGPQFAAKEFQDFADHYGFLLTTSSPYFAQANGEAEMAVKIAKTILSTTSPDVALMNYRATPHSATGVAPSVALMGRVINTRLPILPVTLTPQPPDDAAIRAADQSTKSRAKMSYDRIHGAKPLAPLSCGNKVLVREHNKWGRKGVVVSGDTQNRTYLVNTGSGLQRRNRVHLLPVREPVPSGITTGPSVTPSAGPAVPPQVPSTVAPSAPTSAKVPDPRPPDIVPQVSPEIRNNDVEPRRSSRAIKRPNRLIEEP